MSKISIIVPVYKAEKYLIRCTESILNQTFSDIELILVDDGSPDNCPQLCDELALKDKRVKVIHQNNAGVSAARNAGLDIATGEYCAFVDSDDFLEPDMYKNMLDKALLYQCDVVMCDCVKDNGVIAVPYTHNIRSGFYNNEQLHKEYYPHLLIMENVEYPATISNWTLLFKRKLVSNIRYLIGVRFSEDLLFGAQILSLSSSFYYMKGCNYYHYWMNPDSVTHTFVVDKWKDYKKLFFATKEYFANYEEFDFSEQLDKVLLFFVYNAVGDLMKNTDMAQNEKIKTIKNILGDKIVRLMFSRINVFKLPITIKLKVMTVCYKYQFGIDILCKYLSGK